MCPGIRLMQENEMLKGSNWSSMVFRLWMPNTTSSAIFFITQEREGGREWVRAGG